jgi:hypothetical protein
VLDGTIRRRTVRESNSSWERCCNRKRAICVFGPPLCLAIEINDVRRRSHQNVNLFAASAVANRSVRYWVVERISRSNDRFGRLRCARYQSQHATEPVTREVYPYGLARHKGSLYLAALAVKHESIRLYEVDRIDAVEITEFSFQRPADFDMLAYLAGAFGIYTGSGEVTVIVKFVPLAARFVQESRWHASQVLTQERYGSLLARLTLSTTVEIKNWVLGFGGNAVVIEPEELRAEITRELEQMIQAHQGQQISSK